MATMSLGRRMAVLVVSALMALTLVTVSPAAWADNGHHYGQLKNGNHGHQHGGGGDVPTF